MYSRRRRNCVCPPTKMQSYIRGLPVDPVTRLRLPVYSKTTTILSPPRFIDIHGQSLSEIDCPLQRKERKAYTYSALLVLWPIHRDNISKLLPVSAPAPVYHEKVPRIRELFEKDKEGNVPSRPAFCWDQGALQFKSDDNEP